MNVGNELEMNRRNGTEMNNDLEMNRHLEMNRNPKNRRNEPEGAYYGI